MAGIKYCQTNTLYQAGSGNAVGASSVVLTTLSDIYGNVLTMTDFGDKGYGTCEPDTTNEEAFTFTGVTANANGTYTLTGVKTALAKSPYTETANLIRQHAGGSKVVITDNVAFWNTFPNKNNDETVGGQWTFTNTPIVPGTVSDASTTVKGVTKLSIAPVLSTNPIAVGDNDTRLNFINSQSYGTGVTSIPASTTTKVTLNTNSFANGLTWSGANSRFTVVTSGQYLVSGQITYISVGGANQYLSLIQLNGSGVNSLFSSSGGTAGWDVSVTCTGILNLTAGDYIELFARHNNAGAQNITNSIETMLSIARV